MSYMSDLLENNTPSESSYYEDGGASSGGNPGFFGSILNNLASGFESVVGGGLNYVGANLDRLDEIGRATSYSDEIRNGGKTGLGKLGDWLINNGEYLNNDATKRNQYAGTLNKYQDETVLQRLTDLGYLTDSRGLLADVSNMTGSAIPFAAASAIIPGSGLGAKVARGAGSLAERAGLGTIGRAIASEEGQSAAGAATRWALGGGTLEPITNAGSMYSELKNQGLSDDEIARRMNSAALEELPVDMVTQGLFGPILEGKGLAPFAKTGGTLRRGAIRALNIPGASASEYLQEMAQQQVQNKWTGQPYGTLLNPTEDEQQAGRAAFMGTLPLGLFGAARGAFRKRKVGADNSFSNTTDGSSNSIDAQRSAAAEARSEDPTNPFAGQPEVIGSAPSIDVAPVPSAAQSPSGDAGKEAFFNAISGQESGGDYSAENPDTGAFGKYQIMPDNWPSWAEEAGLGSDAEQTPENQEVVAKFKLGQLYDTYGPAGAMVAWYAGDENAKRYVNGESTDCWGRSWTDPQSNGPSIQSYVDEVMGKIGSEPQQEQQSPSAPTYDLPTQSDAITDQVSHLKPDFQQALPVIGGMLNQAGVADGAQISSAARTPEHNAEVGGVENSYHIDHGDGGDAVDIVLPDGTTDEQAQSVLQMFKDTGAFEEVLFHDVGSGYHLHLGGYKGGLGNGSAAPGPAKASMPKVDLSKLDLTPEQQAQNQAAAEALVSSGQVSPEQQAAVMQMAQSMVMVPTDNSAEADIARANVLQQAVDNNDLQSVYRLLPQETVQTVASTMAPSVNAAATAAAVVPVAKPAAATSSISVDQLDPTKFSPSDRISYALNNGDYVGAAKVADSVGDTNTARLFLRAVNNPDVANQIQYQISHGVDLSVPQQSQNQAATQQVNDMPETMQVNAPAVAPIATAQQVTSEPVTAHTMASPAVQAEPKAPVEQYQANQEKTMVKQPSQVNGAIAMPAETAAQAAAISSNADRIAARMNEINAMPTGDRVSLGKKLLKQMVTSGESMGETFKDELSHGGSKAIAKAEERIDMRAADSMDTKSSATSQDTVNATVHTDDQSNLTDNEKMFMNYVNSTFENSKIGFADILKALYDERRKAIRDYAEVLRSQMKQGVIPRQAIIDENGNATRNFIGGGSLNYKWYRDMLAMNNGRIPNKAKLNAYLEQTAEEHLSNGYVDPKYGVQVGPDEVMDYEIREAAINGLEGIAGKVKGLESENASGKGGRGSRSGKAVIRPERLNEIKAIGSALYEESNMDEGEQTTSETGRNPEDNDRSTEPQASDVNESEQASTDGEVSTTDDEQEHGSEKENNTGNKKAADAFGSSKGKQEALADMLGLKPKAKAKVVNIVDDSDEALESYFKEAEHKMNQLHSGIDPTLLVPLFKIGMVYTQRGINNFADFAGKVADRLGDKIRPWLRAAWETVQAYPKDLPFNEKHMNAVFTYVGSRVGEGASLDDIKRDFADAYGIEETKPFMPMFDCAYKGVQTYLNEKGDSSNADDSTGKLAERAGRGTDKNAVGSDDGQRKPSRGSEPERVQPAGTESGAQGSVRVRDRGTAAGRETGNSGVQAEKSSNRTGSTGSTELSGSVRDSYDGSMGIDDGRTAADIKPVENRRVDEGTVKPNKVTDKAGNLDSIKNDLPMLLPEQQEDVAFAERRLDDNGAQGVMFTNGTGTGKTFTGLGVIKRMVLQGKKNILIVSPTAEINKQWVETAKEFFGLDISPLDSTTDNGGSGICITTYANFQSNKELVKRNWDAVVADESHNLMNNKGGEDTGYIKMLRVLTMHPREAINRFKLLHRTKEIIRYEKENDELAKQVSNLKKQAKSVHDNVAEAAKLTAKEKEMRDNISDNTQAIYDIYASMAPERKAFEQQMKELPVDARPKAIFLSATPFAYDKDVDYAEGYLFNYDADDHNGGYNHAGGRDKFMIQNFGYRMRYNKLTRPEAEVDNRVMEVSFHDKLVQSGAMSGRQIDVDKDYDRGFLLVDGGIGKKIDEGFTWLQDNKKYRELSNILSNQFKNRERKYLLESIKAKAAIPFIQKYAKSGKKVVLFHQAMVEKRNVHPFKLKPIFSTQSDDERMKILHQYEAFKNERPDLVKLNLNGLPSPMETLKNELGKHAVYVDGQTTKKERAAAIKAFNDDKSGMNVIVVQQDAGNAGISLHDTTGKHPRVMINIAMPERPSYAMQIEGRIFRVGNASNATFRYLATGMNIEKEMFANTIGGRAATVENLAIGAEARGLHESFTDAYMETMDGTWKRRLPGHPDEGTGGKAKDMAQRAALSEYDRAKSFYFANQKKTSATKAAEGNDYFATPEPVGLKMVEWLGLKAGDRALEPSAGHGAISRWFSPNTQNTIVEPNTQLAPLAQMVTPESKVIHDRFEDFNIINKFDGIAMNPPFGTGGKTAVEHIAKAYRQLADGGRMVAIMPDGPAAEKHFDKWFYGTTDADGKVVDAAPKGAVLTATIKMPGVMFGRAGTGVATKILVIDKQMDAGTREIAEQEAGIDVDLRNTKDIKDLFDRMENMTMPDRITGNASAETVKSATDKTLDEKTAAGEREDISPDSNFTAGSYEHTKTHEMLPSAKLNERIDDFKPLKSLVKKNGGYYSRFAKAFLFDDAAKRDQFIKEADALMGPSSASVEGSAANMLEKITFPDESALSGHERHIANFGKSLGVPVTFFDGPSQLHGFHRNGITFLNRSSATSLPWTFWHETFHWLRNNNPGLYQQMVDYVGSKEAFSPDKLQAYRDDIGRPELSDKETIEEMMADAMPDVKKRVSFLKDLGKDNPSLAQRIVAWIRDIMDRFRDALHRPGAGLTTAQSEAMRNAFANLAADMVDADGKRIFRVTGKERDIRTFKGEPLVNAQLSLDNSDTGQQENVGKDRIKYDSARWNELCDIYDKANKDWWKKNNNGKLYKFMDMPLALEMVSNNNMHLSIYGSFFAHAIRDIHKGMDLDIVRKLPMAMANPMMIFKDKGKYIFVLETEDKNGVKVIVPVELEKTDERHGIVNIVNTAYGKTKSDGVSQNENWIVSHIDKGHLVYIDKEKALLTGHHGLTLRVGSAINSALSKSSIKTEDDLVNMRKENNTKYSVNNEPAGAPKRIYHALMDLVGLGDTKLESNVEQRKAKGDKENSLDNLGMLDMWAKSVRQVARKNEAVKFFYGLGRKAYSEQEHLRNEYAGAMRRFNAYTKNEQDNKDVSSVLWQGDAEGRDFTVKELKDMGLSDNAIKAYHVVRDNLKKAYKMVNDARMQVKVRSRTMSRNDIDDFKASHFLGNSDILKITPKEDGRVMVTYRGAKVHEVTGVVVSEDAFKGMKGDRDIVVTNEIELPGIDGEKLYKVNYTERIKPLVNRTGYMPHFFHKFMVYEKYTDDEGKEKLVSLGSGESLKKAAELANKYAKEMPDREYVIRPHGFESDEEYNNVVVGDTNYNRMTRQIADHTEMTLAQANQFLHDSAHVNLKGRHRFFGNMQKRTGAEGWDKDMSWALAHYFNAASRYVAMEHFKPDAVSTYERLFGDFNAEPKNNTAKYIKKFIADMNGNPQWIEEQLNKALDHTSLGRNLADYYNGRPALALSGNISYFNAVTKLGLGNFASAAINFMQFINVATRLNSYKYAMRGLHAALKPNEMDNRIIDASGVMDEVNLSGDAGGYTQRRDYGKARKGLAKIKQAADFSMKPFTWADSLMRKAAVLGGYYQGVEEKGMKPAEGEEISKAALNYANDVNFDANFDYSAVSTPGAIRAGSVLTQQMFQFQKYPIMQFEFLWNNVIKATSNAQRARFLVPYLLLAGAVGSIPFGDLMNQFLSFLFGLYSGKDENLADDVKAELMKWAGNDPSKRALVNTVLYGVLSNIGIDVSSRVGMSNSFSGEFYGNKPEGAAGMIASVMGGPLVSTAVNVIHQAHEHNPIEAIKAVSPALGNIMQAIAGETRTTHHRVGSVYTTAYDRIIHGLGFRSVDETNNSFVNSYLYNSRKQQAEDKKDAMDEYIRNPSDINRRNLNDLGISDKTLKKYKDDSEKSAKDRGQADKKPSKNSKIKKKPETEGQRNDRELKAFTK